MSLPRYRKVLVTGARGQLASALLRQLPSGSEAVPITREDLDISDDTAVAALIEGSAPDLVINGAAYNLVDKAEGEGSRDSIRINTEGVANLAKTCRDRDIPLVHFSTDYVFDGKKQTPYTESDATGPLGIYAASKLAGENITLAESPRNVVVRVCRLFGPAGESGAGSPRKPSGNFPALMRRLGQERGVVKVVNDQIGSPTYTPDLAKGIWQLLESGAGGLFQITNAGEVAFDEYARTVFALAGIDAEVIPVSSEDYGAAAKRPKYSAMSNAKAESAGMVPLRNWREALEEYLGTLESTPAI